MASQIHNFYPSRRLKAGESQPDVFHLPPQPLTSEVEQCGLGIDGAGHIRVPQGRRCPNFLCDTHTHIYIYKHNGPGNPGAALDPHIFGASMRFRSVNHSGEEIGADGDRWAN